MVMNDAAPKMTLKQLTLLAQWSEAQKMVQESQSPTASLYERTRLAQRTTWALEIGQECLKAGLVDRM
jgi:hypothetical protein